MRHIVVDMQARASSKGIRQHTTGVAFGAHGDRLAAIYHADHVYAFDITGSPASASVKGQGFLIPFGQGCSAPARCLGNAEEGSYSSSTPMEAEMPSSM